MTLSARLMTTCITLCAGAVPYARWGVTFDVFQTLHMIKRGI